MTGLNFQFPIHRFSHQAMAATFEIFIQHDDAHYAGQAARQAFDELDRLEGELSRFIENSDISRINNLPANKPLRIGLDAFECLKASQRICAETCGAFDVTFSTAKIENRKSKIENSAEGSSMHLMKLNEADYTVELLTSPMKIDLGGIGKGYAVDRMAELLRDWSIDTALINGGFSSVLALKAPSGTKGWPITLSNPPRRFASQTQSSGGKQTLAYLYLQSRAVSGSGLQKGQHIIDPREGRPVESKRAAWACAADAAMADALSTAFMVMTPEEIKRYCSQHPQVLAMIILKGRDRQTQKDKILRFGPWDVDSSNKPRVKRGAK